MTVQERNIEQRNERGFTLIELLIAIVVVGILAAVAIVGIAGLTNTGSKSACTQSSDSAHAASAAFYANQTPNAWPTTFKQMSDVLPVAPAVTPVNNPPVFELSNGESYDATGMILAGNGWHLTMANGGAVQPTFSCGP